MHIYMKVEGGGFDLEHGWNGHDSDGALATWRLLHGCWATCSTVESGYVANSIGAYHWARSTWQFYEYMHESPHFIYPTSSQ